MTDELVPEHLEAAMTSFREALARTRTQRMRMAELQVPRVPGPTQAELAEAAARPDAPRELRDMARAVEEGRASWDDVLRPRAEGSRTREVAAYFEGARPRFVALMARGEEEERRRGEHA